MPANGETATIPVETKVSIEVSKSLLAKRKMADSDGMLFPALHIVSASRIQFLVFYTCCKYFVIF